jgi:hypothetical protein
VPPTGKNDNSLLGNLPQRRPGVESPRRAEARARRQAAADGDSAPREAAAESAADDTSGFEMLARAGVGLAAGAATAGLRVAGRVAGRLGKAVGRR